MVLHAHAVNVFKNVRTHSCVVVVEMNGRLRSYSSESDSANGQPPSSEKRLTICVVGSGGVGKSSLTVRYLQGHFPEVSSCGSVPTITQIMLNTENRGVDLL